MGILDFLEGEILVPVLALLGQWCRALADFHPLHAAIIVFARIAHVAKVLVARN